MNYMCSCKKSVSSVCFSVIVLEFPPLQMSTPLCQISSPGLENANCVWCGWHNNVITIVIWHDVHKIAAGQKMDIYRPTTMMDVDFH